MLAASSSPPPNYCQSSYHSILNSSFTDNEVLSQKFEDGLEVEVGTFNARFLPGCADCEVWEGKSEERHHAGTKMNPSPALGSHHSAVIGVGRAEADQPRNEAHHTASMLSYCGPHDGRVRSQME